MLKRVLFSFFWALLASPVSAATLKCNVAASTPEKGDPRARAAAQRGLDFMSSFAKAWSERNSQCYGCHVHSVTLEGLVIGKKNQYRVTGSDLDEMIDAMRTRGNGIHSTTFTTARAFGAVALARYDRWIDGRYSSDLLKVGKMLTESQNQDGSVRVDDTRFPVESGVMQATFQAMQGWRQAFARTADDSWLGPMRRAEAWIQKTAQSWKEPPKELQDLNYALLGLSAAGVGAAENLTVKLTRFLLDRQNQDGGWGFRGGSDAFATGQSLYALRTLGRSERDPAVAKGLDWLEQHQKQDGSWGGAVSTQGGSQLGEAMWAVLGLVSVDVMTVSLKGAGDGAHVDGTVQLSAEARDNASGGVAKMEILVDDLSQKVVCGGQIDFAWDTRQLRDGKHIVDVIAWNAKGQESRRRIEVYAGKYFLTQLGARFDEPTQKSQISLRNLAPAGKVAVEIWNGKERIWSSERTAAQGAMNFDWDGKGADGKDKPKGLYTARISYRDANGKLIQTEETQVFHDRADEAKKRFATVEGQLSMKGGAGVAANTELELLDDNGKVVARTRTTEQGNYLFKNVQGGHYKVRARKQGWSDQEKPINAAPAAEAKANFAF
jgi:squalene-hopene/tetraprenyl-beta-curcumene cyclase